MLRYPLNIDAVPFGTKRKITVNGIYCFCGITNRAGIGDEGKETGRRVANFTIIAHVLRYSALILFLTVGGGIISEEAKAKAFADNFEVIVNVDSAGA